MNYRSPLYRYGPRFSKWSADILRGNSTVSQEPIAGSTRPNGSISRQHRKFSARPQKVLNYEDLVRDTIKKMIAERDEGQHTKGIADEVLQRRFQHYQNVFKEAELCIADLREAPVDQIEEESLCATGAVNNAFIAYIELLDDLRQANDEQLKTYHDARFENANNLKRLRQELAAIVRKTV